MTQNEPTFDDVRQGRAGWLDEAEAFAESGALFEPEALTAIPDGDATDSLPDPP